MSSGNEKLELNTDLELGENHSNQCILENDSGAGANAASRADMTFVATGPLSELVWSPDKGLSLKCADSSFSDKKTSLFWDVGPSNFVLATPQSFIGMTSTTDNPIDDVFAKPVAALCIKSNISGTDTPPKHLTSDSVVKQECKKYKEQDTGSNGNMEEMNTVERNICDQANTGTAQISGVKGEKVSTISGQVEKIQFDKLLPQTDEAKPSTEHNPLPMDHTGGGGVIGVGNQASGRSPFEKLESTAENDLQTFNREAACGASSRVPVSKSNEIEKKSQDDEMILPCDKNLPVLHSPSNSRIHMFRNKGKEKALSDGDINLNFPLKEEDDSHESVESCNSAGLFSTGKKRLNFQQQLMAGSKRVKKQIQETSVSKALVKQDSSFINWISNMMKGFSQSIQEATNCLAHSLPHPDHSHGRPNQKLITFNRTQDPVPKNTGFQSIFQSICSPSLKHLGEDSKNFDLGNKVHGIDATPITCCAENDILCRKYLHSDGFEGSRWRYEAGSSLQPINFANSHESSKNNPGNNKNCSNLELSKEKEGMTSNSSSTRHKTNITENIDSSALSERKEADKICHRSNNMGSLWITRFFPKPTSPSKISDHHNQRGGTQVQPPDCSMPLDSLMHVVRSSTCKIEENREQTADEARELPICSINIAASTGTMNDKVNNDHKSIYKFNPILPSPRFRNSELMASMFARRSEAVKHIIPSNRTDITGKENMTCLFCGTKGHQLCDCSEIARNELQDLLKRVNSYVELGEPCLCIKCFQPNHWAISCPTSISRGKHEMEVNALVNDCSPSIIQFNVGNRDSSKLLSGEEEDRRIFGCAINNEIDPQAKKNLNLKQKSNEVITSVKIGSNASIKKHFGSDSEENNLKENAMRSLSCFVERNISDVPEKIFDAVKKLRLSRTDILKWMDSHMSISHLDGFYLRLRLGKWEEGLGGTGYYVASINEAHGQTSQQNTRKSLSVNVGGIKCMVESRYISNHDFLEEEIMAWWCTTSKSSGKFPSEEDLIEKIKKKRMLGF